MDKFSFEIFSLLFGFYDVHEARGMDGDANEFDFYSFLFSSHLSYIHIRLFVIQDYAADAASLHTFLFASLCLVLLA